MAQWNGSRDDSIHEDSPSMGCFHCQGKNDVTMDNNGQFIQPWPRDTPRKKTPTTFPENVMKRVDELSIKIGAPSCDPAPSFPAPFGARSFRSPSCATSAPLNKPCARWKATKQRWMLKLHWIIKFGKFSTREPAWKFQKLESVDAFFFWEG